MIPMRVGFTLTPEDKIELEKYQECVTEAIMQKARGICSGSPVRSHIFYIAIIIVQN
jgi:hypothetical protein